MFWLAGLAMLLLCQCGGDESGPAATTTADGETAPAVSSEETAPAAAPQGATADESAHPDWPPPEAESFSGEMFTWMVEAGLVHEAPAMPKLPRLKLPEVKLGK